MKAVVTAKGRRQALKMMTELLGQPPQQPLSEETVGALLLIYAAITSGLRTQDWADARLGEVLKEYDVGFN